MAYPAMSCSATLEAGDRGASFSFIPQRRDHDSACGGSDLHPIDNRIDILAEVRKTHINYVRTGEPLAKL